MKRCTQFLFAILLFGLLGTAVAKKKSNKVDHVALAALLVKDGYFQRAALILKQVKPASFLSPISTKETQLQAKKRKKRVVRFYTLKGVIALRLKKFEEATKYFQLSLKAGQTDAMIYLFLAQSHFQLQQYKEALAAILKAPSKAEEQPGTFLLKAQCYWKLKRKQEAYATLVAGRLKHPKVTTILRLQLLLLMEMRLYREAMKQGRVYLSLVKDSTEPWLMLGDALRKGRQYKEAALFLEEARLRFGDEQKILLLLARVYLEGEKPFSAAVILERAALRDRKLLAEAAELYRRARRLWRAVHANARILNQKVKFRQRLGLLIQMQRFEEAATLEARLSRLGLLKEQKLRYALAFACFKSGRSKDTLRLLRGITNPSLFQKAIALRKAIQLCRQRKEGCQ